MDHVWVNKYIEREGGIILEDTTDHLPTFIVLKDVPHIENQLTKIEFRDHSFENKRKFIQKCSEINWQFSCDNVNDNVVEFSNFVDELYRGCFPLKTKYLSRKRLSNPWLSAAILKSIKNKSNLFKKSKLNFISAEFYKRYKNRLTNVIRAAKRTHYRAAFTNCKNDMKSTCLLYTSPSPRDKRQSRMPSSA